MVVVQLSPVTPIHIFFYMTDFVQGKQRIAEAKQNDALRCRVSVLIVTDIRFAGSFFPILAYLARPCCVQREVNWAISAVTQISDKMRRKL